MVLVTTTSRTPAPPAQLVRRIWRDPITRGVLVLALASLVTNYLPRPEMEGDWEVFSYLRKSLSYLCNSGTAWAWIAIFAGWHSRTIVRAVLMGSLAAEASLVVHYALGQLIGLYDAGIWSDNSHWFLMGLWACAPLGAIGWLARHPNPLGLLARLVVPAGAMLEPFYLGRFNPIPFLPWPNRWASITCGALLLAGGLLGALAIVVRELRHRPVVPTEPCLAGVAASDPDGVKSGDVAQP